MGAAAVTRWHSRTRRLHNTRHGLRRRPGDKLCKSTQVLDYGCQSKLKLAARGPRSRRRPSLRIRLRWANSISTRLRSRRDCSKASEPASARAVSRASFMDATRDLARWLLRAASHFKWAHVAIQLARPVQQQSSFMIRPVVVSTLPAGHGQTSRALSNVKSWREKVPSSRLDLSACPFADFRDKICHEPTSA
jgi:hypothetical protein